MLAALLSAYGLLMFAGIVEGIGVVGQEESPDRFSVRSELFEREKASLKVGDSVAVNGVCLTIVQLAEQRASFDLASETRRRTTLGGLRPGAEVNLELSLRFGARVDGHFVQGHVDAVSEVLKCEEEGETLRLTLTLPEEVRGLLVRKGAVALDGVSLTIGEVELETFSVYLIPHTKQVTTFKNVQAGRLVNVEADSIARYVRGVIEGFELPSARGTNP